MEADEEDDDDQKNERVEEYLDVGFEEEGKLECDEGNAGNDEDGNCEDAKEEAVRIVVSRKASTDARHHALYRQLKYS